MKIKVLSDLHLEFGNFDPGTGDVLVLAGDICTACSFVFRGEEEYADRYLTFFEKCVENYNKVFYVMGNHEHYNGYFEETEHILRNYLPKEIVILHNQSVYYEGCHFVGATLWSDYLSGDKEVMKVCSETMNDYVYVWHMGGDSNLTPNDFLKEHENTVTWLNQCLPTLRGNVVVISHHPPSFKSIESDYVHSDTIGAYASNLESLIERHSIDLWVHGHVHGSQDYELHNTQVVCNPRGYTPDGLNPNFDPEMELNLRDYEETI